MESIKTEDEELLQGTHTYFVNLRSSLGHKPTGSQIDLEILLLLRIAASAMLDPIPSLASAGIILTGPYAAINAALLKQILATGRSRINHSFGQINWGILDSNPEIKASLLSPLVDHNALRNWTVRVVPSDSPVFSFATKNPSIKYKQFSPPRT